MTLLPHFCGLCGRWSWRARRVHDVPPFGWVCRRCWYGWLHVPPPEVRVLTEDERVTAAQPTRCAICGGTGRHTFSNATDVYDTDGDWQHLEPTDHVFIRAPYPTEARP
jgi:hypothetical protein